jgi:hypothetical protein
MRKRDIKIGRMYETEHGRAKALALHGSRPPTIKMNVERRGIMFVKPRDVLRETGGAEPPVASAPTAWPPEAEVEVVIPGEDLEKIERTTRRTKFIAEGCATLTDVMVGAADFIRECCRLQAAGFELIEPVSDGYLHLEKEG